MNTAEVLIIGAGPAGLSAAITLASEGRSVILLEKQNQAGGQAGTSSLIENFPPHPEGFSGSHFTEACCRQCLKFGVGIQCGIEVRSIVPNCGAFTVLTNQCPYQARAILLALGLQHRSLGVPGEKHPDIYYGMRMDALDECSDDVYPRSYVVLVGGGNSVGQAAVYYLDRGVGVAIVARRPIEETMSDYLVRRVKPHVDVVLGEVKAFDESAGGLRVYLKDYSALVAVDCVHIFIGQQPSTDWLAGLVERDEAGFILTNSQHQTSRPGIFAVGDVVAGSVKRVSCAIGYANAAVPAIHRYLESLRSQDLDAWEQLGCEAA